MIKDVQLHYNVALSSYEIQLVIDEISQAQRLMGIINEELKLDEAEDHMGGVQPGDEVVTEAYAATIAGEPYYYSPNSYIDYICPNCGAAYILAPHEWTDAFTIFTCDDCGEEVECIANPDIK